MNTFQKSPCTFLRWVYICTFSLEVQLFQHPDVKCFAAFSSFIKDVDSLFEKCERLKVSFWVISSNMLVIYWWYHNRQFLRRSHFANDASTSLINEIFIVIVYFFLTLTTSQILCCKSLTSSYIVINYSYIEFFEVVIYLFYIKIKYSYLCIIINIYLQPPSMIPSISYRIWL